MSVETLGDAYAAGWTASVRCLGRNAKTKNGTKPCSQQLDLNLPTLIWTRGREFPLAMLPERLKCPSCGCRKVFVVFDMPEKGSQAMMGGG